MGEGVAPEGVMRCPTPAVASVQAAAVAAVVVSMAAAAAAAVVIEAPPPPAPMLDERSFGACVQPCAQATGPK